MSSEMLAQQENENDVFRLRKLISCFRFLGGSISLFLLEGPGLQNKNSHQTKQYRKNQLKVTYISSLDPNSKDHKFRVEQCNVFVT